MYVLQKINKIIQIQKKRYTEKGLFNTILSLILLFGFTKLFFIIGEACWPEHVEDKRYFVFFWTFTLHTVVQFGVFAFHLPGYLGLSSYYQKYMINKRSSWPWKRSNWNEMLKKSIINFVQNQLIIFPCLAYLNNPKYRFDGFPTMTQVIPQFILIYFVEDFFTYWSHRTLHHPKLYRFHKLHHEYDKVYSLAFEYISSVQYICHSVIPSILTFTIAGRNVHCFVFFLWVIWKTTMSSEGHSGFEFPWSPMRAMPLIFGSAFHDHHHSINIGNFAGSCILWDVMLQTGDLYFDEYLKTKKQ